MTTRRQAMTAPEQRAAAARAAALIDRAVILVSQDPLGREVMSGGAPTDRTAGPRQNRLRAAIAVTGDRDAAVLWKQASDIWWDLAYRYRYVCVREATRRSKDPVTVDDLIADGLIGAWEGARRYDPDRAPLLFYLAFWVRAAIKRAAELERLIWLPGDVQIGLRARARGGESPRVSADQMAAAAQVAVRVSLDLEDRSTDLRVVDRLWDPRPSPESDVGHQRAIDFVFRGISPEEERLIAMRLQGYTRKEVAAALGWSVKRAAAVEGRVAERARQRLASGV